jgi:RNA polymerase sigma-70 factor, ECF subfamily
MPGQFYSSTWAWRETSKVLESTGDTTDLESLVRQYSRLVFKVAYGVLRHSHDAEDAVQEVFLRIHRSGARNITDMRAWLATAAFHAAVDRTRKVEALPLDNLDPPSENPDAEHLAISRQRVQYVQKLIAALPEELRYPLVLSALDELNSREIADLLGVSEAAVRGRIFRARQILNDKLDAQTGKKP